MRKVLAAIDGSDTTGRALDYAASLACPGQSLTIHLLFVYEEIPDASRSHAFHSQEELQRPEREHGEAVLKAGAAQIASSGALVVPELMSGEVASTIVARAEALDCDVIVIGMKEQSLLAELVLGSATRSVLQLAKLPVTLVK
jgi:nucleotide-binding universal stress UspA family protein